MLEFVKNHLDYTKPRWGAGKTRIRYDRFEHIKRVYAWMQRIIAELSINVPIREKELHIATIFHDVGYGVNEDNSFHAEAGAEICRNYLKEKGYEEQFIEEVIFLVTNHGRKELMPVANTPIELIVLMEADLMDDTAALGLVMDSMIVATGDESYFTKVYEHMQSYSVKEMKDSPMITGPAKRLWKEKQDLTEEFIRQLKRDLNIE